MVVDRLLQQVIQFFLRFIDTAAPDFRWRLPVSIQMSLAACPLQEVAGRKLLDTFDHRVRSRYVVQPQETIQAVHVDLPAGFRMGENSFDFGRKNEIIPGPVKVEWLDAHAI